MSLHIILRLFHVYRYSFYRHKERRSANRLLCVLCAVVAASSDTVELSEAKQLLAKERQQRDHFIGLNQMLVEEIKEKSKMAAGKSCFFYYLAFVFISLSARFCFISTLIH